jgi:hypothetical protein
MTMSSSETAKKVNRAPAPARETATFEAYYWEAYNEIVHPSRFDWYLVTRWLPDIGALGFAILKTLRARCYHNPKSGVTRNQIEVDLKELAGAVGVSVATLYRELERNEPLKQFVQLQHQYVQEDSNSKSPPRRFKPELTVCMDDPIHPGDRERYEQLRAEKEALRATAETGGEAAPKFRTRPKSQIENRGDFPYSQFENRGFPKSQIENRGDGSKSQIENRGSLPNSQFETEASLLVSIPSDTYTKGNVRYTPPAGTPSHKCDPQGDDPDPLARTWTSVLTRLTETVSAPTLHTHLSTLRLTELTETNVTIETPSHFTREWLEKRYLTTLDEAFTAVLGTPRAIDLVARKRP